MKDDIGELIVESYENGYISLDEAYMLMEAGNKSINSYFTNINITESCKDVDTARKLCNEVRSIATKYDVNFFFVTDGASCYSNGNNGYNNAVKEMRKHMDDWEKKNGFDPDENWARNTTGSFTESEHKSELKDDFKTKKCDKRISVTKSNDYIKSK